MYFKTYFTFTALLVLAVKGDPDPLSFIASTPPTLPSPSPEFEAQEIIAYLTQEQIEDLKSGRGVLEPVLESQSELKVDKQNILSGQISENNYNNDQLKSLLEQRKKYIKTQSKFVLIENQRENAPLLAKNFEEESQPAPAQNSWYPGEHDRYSLPTANLERNNNFAVTTERPQWHRNFVTTSDPLDINYYVSSTERPDNSNYYIATSEKPNDLNHKSVNYYNVYNEKKGDNINIKIFHPNPKDIVNNQDSKELETRKRNQSNKKNQQTPNYYERENSNEYEGNLENEEPKPKYAIRYSNNQQATRIQDSTKRQKGEVLKKVNTANTLSTPRPYILHVSQPIEIKAHKTYSIPLDFIRHGPVATGGTEEEKPGSYEIERSVSSPGSQQVDVKVDNPYLVERIVPVDVVRATQAPQKLRILGSAW